VRSGQEAWPARSDDELMTLGQAGVRAAFEALVDRHALRLMNACARLVNDVGVGEELAQETWAAAWAARFQYRAEGKFFGWLLTIARNGGRNHLRRQGAGRDVAVQIVAPDAPAPSPSQIDALLVDERRRRVRQALSRLPARMREALLLRYGEDLRYDEMAEVLRVGESTLRSRVHHGLRQLRELLEKNR